MCPAVVMIINIIHDYSKLFVIIQDLNTLLSKEERLQFPGEYSMCPAVVMIINLPRPRSSH